MDRRISEEERDFIRGYAQQYERKIEMIREEMLFELTQLLHLSDEVIEKEFDEARF